MDLVAVYDRENGWCGGHQVGPGVCRHGESKSKLLMVFVLFYIFQPWVV